MRVWIRSLVLLLILGAGAALAALTFFNRTEAPVMLTVYPKASEAVLSNPYMGLAPSAQGGPYRQPHRLVYLTVTWRELEPERGRFAFEAMERKFKFAKWDAQGVKVIIRPVLDYSTDVKHMDIPDWVYEAIRGDGVWYDEEIGRGFSPRYDNPVLIDLHGRFIRKLGERYNDDPRVAFIALGSLGHWGEWHTYSDEEVTIPFPKLAVSDQYVEHYLDAFPGKKLLLRRPHPIAKARNIGLYNDMFGAARSTADYIDWFENGYFSSLAGGVQMPAMPDFWKRAPSGGEFGNADEARTYVQDGTIDGVLNMARRSHLSWVGATLHAEMELNAAEQANLDKLVKLMGYRFRVKKAVYPAATVVGGKAEVRLQIANDGVAPFYYDWPLELSLADAAGRTVARTTASRVVMSWMPGVTTTVAGLDIPKGVKPGVYRLRLAVLDPATGKPGIALAMEGRQPDGRYDLGGFTVRRQTRAEQLRAWLGVLSSGT